MLSLIPDFATGGATSLNLHRFVETLKFGFGQRTELADPAFKDKMVRFVRASMKGWEYAMANPEEAGGIVIDAGGQDENHQVRMMSEVAKLIDVPDAKLIPAAYERTAKALLDQKIIEKAPEGAYTTEITDAM